MLPLNFNASQTHAKAGCWVTGVINGKEHKFLIDSGAHISVISSKVVKNKGYNSPRFILSGLSGRKVHSLGSTTLTFSIGQCTFTEEIEVIATVGTNYSAILGLDFLIKHQAKIDLSQHTVELDGNFFPLSTAATKGNQSQGHSRAHETPIILRHQPLKVDSLDKIPPCTGRILWIDVNKELPDNTLCIVEPISENETLDEAHCFVRRSVVRVRNIDGNRKIPIHVDNFSSAEQVLQKGVLIAALSVLEEDDFDWSESDQINKPTCETALRPKLQHLKGQDRVAIETVITEFKDLFNPCGKLPATHITQHRIPTGNNDPVYKKPYRVPRHLQPIMEEFIEQQLRDGIIEESNSPWGAPVIIIPKKSIDGTKQYRFCCDYRHLNSKTTTDVYPLPNITETLDHLGESKYFSTIDLRSGYHQLEVAIEDRPKTAFNVPTGHYQYRRMPFGLKNAPATFQRLMDGVLRGLKPKQCMVYLDDVIIFSTTIEQHAQRLREVFSRLRNARLTVNIEKCNFAVKKVTYLGHVITEHGVHTDPRLIDAVKTFAKPNSVKELQSFLGLANYYRKFIQNFASIAQPLTQLLKKGVKFCWTPECDTAFNTLKKKLTESPVLIFPNYSKEFILSCDASGHCIGAVLSQEVDGKEHPVAYASRQLNKAERNYSTTEKEMLSLIFAINHFRCYLYGRKFRIITDHSALKWLLGLKDPSSRLTRWALKLSEFDYEVVHKPGKKHGNADGLSRKIAALEVINNDIAQWQQAQAVDSDCTRYANMKDFEYCDGLLCRRTKLGLRIVVPKSLQPDVMKASHDHILAGHGGLRTTNRRVAEKYWWATRHSDVTKYVLNCVDCAKRADIQRQKIPLQRLPEASQPFQMLGLDILGPFHKTPAGNRYVLTIIDHFSRYVCMIAMPNQQANTVAQALVNNWLLKFGVPDTIVTDQGTNFMSDLFKQLCHLLRVRKLRTSPLHPQSNGRTERVHRTIGKMLSYYVNQQGNDWDTYLPYILAAYNSKTHSGTGYSPYETVFGRKMPSPFDIVKPRQGKNGEAVRRFARTIREVWQRVLKANTKALERQEQSTRHASLPEYRVGQWVLLSTPYIPKGKTKKFVTRYQGPYQVIERTSAVNVKLQLPTRTTIVHISRIKPFKGIVDTLPPVTVPPAKQRQQGTTKQVATPAQKVPAAPYHLRPRRTHITT